MLGGDHLTLRQVRLEPAKEWFPEQEGFLFLFPQGGTGKLHGAGTQERVGPGEVIVLSSSGGGKLRADSGEGLVFGFFSLCVEHLYPLFSGQEISLLHQITDSLKGSKRLTASNHISEQCHKLLGETPPKFDLDHRSQLLRVVALILTDEFNTAARQRAGYMRMEDYLIHVFETLSSHDLASLPIGDLAKRFACSRRHLNRLFHQYFGFSVASLRMEMRLLKAVSLLRNADAKIINVAEECGFNHLGLFNTCFKRRFGASPGQWRKTVVQTQTPPTGPLGSGLLCPLRSSGLCPGLGDKTHDDVTGSTQGIQTSGAKATLKGSDEVAPGLGPQTLSIRDLRDELLGPGPYRASA